MSIERNLLTGAVLALIVTACSSPPSQSAIDAVT